MKIALFGGTGFIGQKLQTALSKAGHSHIVLDIRRDRDWEKKLHDCHAVVNLAGTPLFKSRWSAEFMCEILASRVEGTKKIVEALARLKESSGKSLTLINASAIGFYGSSRQETFTETSASGTDFLAMVCRDWEDAALTAQRRFGIRTVIGRIGVVLGLEGGALPKLITPFNLFLGGPINFGREWMSWVHVDDVVKFFVYAVEHETLSGIYNLTAPQPVSNAEFSKALGAALERPSWLPVPGFGLKLLMGDSAQVVIYGQKVLPKRTLESGFQFGYTKVSDALNNVIRHEFANFTPKDEMYN